MALTHHMVCDTSGEPLSRPAALELADAHPAAVDQLLEAGRIDAARVAAAEARETIRHLRSEDPRASHPAGHRFHAADHITAAELRVLGLLETYRSVPEIAAELYVSCNTVKTHVRSIYAKLDASSRAEAVREARARGLLPVGPRGRDPLDGAA